LRSRNDDRLRDIRDYSDISPDIASAFALRATADKSLIWTTLALVVSRAGLFSQLHPWDAFRCLGTRPRDGWCGSRHTLSALSASSSAKEPRCSQTCRKCVWSI